MRFISYIFAVLSNYAHNLHYLGKFDLKASHQDVLSNQNQKIACLQEELKNCKKNILELNAIVDAQFAEQYREELSYLKQCQDLAIFPYPQQKTITHQIDADFDNAKKLPYVIHNNKRLYFPQNFSIQNAIDKYKYFIETENLLGGNYTTKAPHQYQTDTFKIEENDILLDIGCAEALVALDAIEKVKKVYLFEGDKTWFPALQATFEPYNDKVVLIKKFISDHNDEENITLDAALKDETSQSFFVKMDIEGAETLVLSSSKDFFTSTRKIKLACCTYHKADHADIISQKLQEWNYKYEFSDGYMLFTYDLNFVPPYFRHGLIRGKNFID